MGLKRLRSLRIAVAIFFFALIAFLFLDYRDLGSRLFARELLYLQFAPSLLRFLHDAALGATGFVAVLLLTLFVGRVYCSTICPLGTLQDVVGFLRRKFGKGRGYQYSPPRNAIRYVILALTAAFLLAGSGLLLNLLDPFSTFGRIFSNLVRPVVLGVNNLAAIVLEWMGIHVLYRIPWPMIAPLSVGVAIGMLVLVVLMSVKNGRLYCNTVCPVGALLGLVARLSVLRIAVDPDACTRCGRCERVCKAGCIDIRNGTVDFTRCVGCCNCFAACRDDALRFECSWRPSPRPSQPDEDRRSFIRNSMMWLIGIPAIAGQPTKIIQSKPTTIPIPATPPIPPPGAISIAHFTSKCTACHLCVSICPSNVLVPSLFEYGLSGMMQPRMNYHAGYCNYDCMACLKVCPSGAILPMSAEKKKLTQLGVAKFIKENCVVYTDNTDCGACSEHCPTKAVKMVPYPNPANKPLVIPEVTEDYCVGCGACEYACPTRPYRAIYVEGNPIHETAEMPVEEKLDHKIDYREDFPF
ncbi:MAG: 4Fe-4S binding protein [Candidatus Coatesbacteria bacterium]|nr:4Fe-4S binding protein [Candidatus Coatesbacteria bacterium]